MTGDVVVILRQELQKCLAVVRAKRAEISSLRAELDQRTANQEALEGRYETVRDDRDKMQVSVTDYNYSKYAPSSPRVQ